MKNTSLLALIVALLVIALAGAVYAHGSDSSRWNMWGHMFSVEEMDEMHDYMTANLDPELKEQMDIMHEGCTSSFSKKSGYRGMMR